MLDLHTHILFGLDDGAVTVEDSLALARSLAADGVGVVVGTPHVRADYPTEPAAMEESLAAVRAAVAAEGIPIEVRGGAEIAVERLGRLTRDDLARFGLGGNPHLVLLEYPDHGHPVGLVEICAGLVDDGIVPLVGHPERNATLQARPEDLAELVHAGALVQVTAGSVAGSFGKSSARCARRLLELGLVHVVASDVHRAGSRRAGIAAITGSLGDEAYARWLTTSVPAALLAGDPLPPRPPWRQGLLARLRR